MRAVRASGLLATLILGSGLAHAAGPGDPVDFNRDVRPILSETCFQCHGPDSKKRKAELRLDTKDGLFAKKDKATPIVPGKPDESELYLRVTSVDSGEHMPPPKSGKSLTKAQVETLRRWIEQGGEWKGHWAYEPPTRPAVPLVGESPFVRNDVDRFVVEKLNERGLKPAPEADRATLIRRLSLDLLGLPPSPEEVDAFVNDSATNAYERLVDRLLASPHFGERMAVYWLDLVRFADSAGYHSDNPRDLWLYRDYVIRAFNDNMPFDRFTIEQLAGDLLPSATDEQKVASGYNRLLQTTEEGGAQAKEYMAKYAADRVRNVGSVWLASTLGCCECHDHKFDPFATKDFYSFEAFFADLKEKAVGRQDQVKIPSAEQKDRLARLDAEMGVHQKVLATPTPELASAQAEWEKTGKTRRIDWAVLRPVDARSKNGATLKVQGDGSVLATGNSPESDTYTLTFKADRSSVTGLRLEVLPDDSLPAHGPGRAGNGNFVLDEIVIAELGKPIVWSSVTATHSQDGFPVANIADGKPGTGWALLPKVGQPTDAVFESKSDLGGNGSLSLTVELRMNYGTQHTIGHFRFSVTDAARPVRAKGAEWPKNVADILATEPEKRSPTQNEELAAFYRTIAPALEPQRKALAELQRQKEQLEQSVPTTLIAEVAPPRMIRVLPRGNWLNETGPVVEPTVPASLGSMTVKDRRATRLDLARWLVARDNPLVARVFVNRLWKLAFGQGIVTSLEDFGSQGTWPTHPHLLDWLAVEFMDKGWDVKRTLKLLVLSSTYRQSSVAHEELRQRDPANSWLARQGRFRLDAEMVRDNALAIGGLLDPRVGGPSVKPYQPDGYWAHLNFPRREYVADHGPNEYRRGLYTWWQRSFLHPSLLAFDASTREECVVQRPRSNTPLQALVLLNDPSYVEAARAFAERVVRKGGADAPSRIRHAYKVALARDVRPAEIALLEKLVERQRSELRANPDGVAELLHVGDRPAPSDIDAAELAAWTAVARVILNLHETVTRN
ncbi:MAG: PSD1 and planctomycete cytochrome C domain-containing protein [Isosphaeraceae bacterium]|nr:PSD1 and planctomycete cytochrome C domain-containing protein [Isosphaeraceae bacterium]